MKVLLYGGGAREHSLVWKISQSPLLTKLYLSNANEGFSHMGEVLVAETFEELALKAKKENIDILVVGPENPLAEGIVDVFEKVGIPAIGVNKQWAELESSKSFAKEFMQRNNIPTAKYQLLTDKKQIDEALENFSVPLVIKADGLAAGKGVKISSTIEEAKADMNGYLDGEFGEASKKIVIEEFLIGREISLIALWDGHTLLPLIPAQDHKKLLNNDEGPNTGGMGAFCPVHLSLNEQKSIDNYVINLQNALKKEKADFVGIVYSGLMMTKDGLQVLEYNMRFGDPETQALMMHLESDILYVFDMAIKRKLEEVKLYWKAGTTLCLVVAAEGYPYNPVKDGKIKNTDALEEKYGVNIFFAGVKKQNDIFMANGGRVLSICKTDSVNDVYNAAESLDFDNKYYRTDIGRI
jgi:phosphoribosylamine--glycine ligase